MWAAVSLGGALRDIPKKRLRRKLILDLIYWMGSILILFFYLWQAEDSSIHRRDLCSQDRRDTENQQLCLKFNVGETLLIRYVNQFYCKRIYIREKLQDSNYMLQIDS